MTLYIHIDIIYFVYYIYIIYIYTNISICQQLIPTKMFTCSQPSKFFFLLKGIRKAQIIGSKPSIFFHRIKPGFGRKRCRDALQHYGQSHCRSRFFFWKNAWPLGPGRGDTLTWQHMERIWRWNCCDSNFWCCDQIWSWWLFFFVFCPRKKTTAPKDVLFFSINVLNDSMGCVYSVHWTQAGVV